MRTKEVLCAIKDGYDYIWNTKWKAKSWQRQSTWLAKNCVCSRFASDCLCGPFGFVLVAWGASIDWDNLPVIPGWWQCCVGERLFGESKTVVFPAPLSLMLTMVMYSTTVLVISIITASFFLPATSASSAITRHESEWCSWVTIDSSFARLNCCQNLWQRELITAKILVVVWVCMNKL